MGAYSMRVHQLEGCGAVGGAICTSLDWRMLPRGIHRVPTMVSQISPLFHTSTVRPKSSRLISLREGDRASKGSGMHPQETAKKRLH